MTTERMKELREWVTCVASCVTFVAIPLGWLVMNNQRLNIEADVAKTYVPVTQFQERTSRMEGSLGEVKGQLNAVLIEQAHLSDAVAAVKEKLNGPSAKH